MRPHLYSGKNLTSYRRRHDLGDRADQPRQARRSRTSQQSPPDAAQGQGGTSPSESLIRTTRTEPSQLAAPYVRELPIFAAHGNADDLVHIDRCYSSLNFLNTELGIGKASAPGLPGVDLHVYEGLGHTTIPKEFEDLKGWLEKVVPAI